MSAAQVLRKMMREAVESHQEAAAHERWLQREIEDAIGGNKLSSSILAIASRRPVRQPPLCATRLAVVLEMRLRSSDADSVRDT